MKIRICKGRRGLLRRTQYFAQIIANNGEEMFRTSETYNNVGDLEQTINTLMFSIPTATIEYEWVQQFPHV